MKYLYLFLLFLPILMVAQTTTTESMMHDGENRSYILHLPPQYDGTTPLPVVFVFHGLGDTASNMQNAGFKQLGDLEGFISVYPQGLESSLGNAWNNGSNISLLGFSPDDLGFVTNMIDLLVNDYAADHTRVYSCGFSMGGIMSHYLGCNLSDKITAIASQAGTMAESVSGNCSPNRPVPAMHIHGDADGTVDYNGDALYGLESAVASIEVWANHNNCTDTPVETTLPDTTNDGFTITKRDYSPCDDNTEVILYTVHGADHIWLTPNNDVSTTIEFWDFFKQFSNPDATTPNEQIEVVEFSIYPNPVNNTLSISGLEKEMNISITDIAGKTILSTKSLDSVDVSTLTKGTYFIQIMDSENGHSTTQKFVKL